MKRRKPKFMRQEGYRLVKLKKKWRRPKGRHSKLRMHEKARGRYPKPGYGSPRLTRGLVSGLREVRVSNPMEIENTDPERDLIVIAGPVGRKKALDIVKAAKAKGIKVRNKPRPLPKKPKPPEESGKKKKEEKKEKPKKKEKEKKESRKKEKPKKKEEKKPKKK